MTVLSGDGLAPLEPGTCHAACRKTHPSRHLRRHCRLQEPRPHPSPARAWRRGAAGHDGGCAAIRDAAGRWRAVVGPCLYGIVLSRRRAGCRAYPPCPRLRPDRRRTRHRRSDGQDGERPCRRPCLHRAARHRPPGAGGAGHESENVGACRNPPQCRDAAPGWHRLHRPQCRRDGGKRRSRFRAHGRTAGNRRGRRGPARWRRKAARRPHGRGDIRPDP